MSGQTAAERLRAKAERLNNHQQPPADTPPAVDTRPASLDRPLTTVPSVHTKPIRSTVDLPPAQHAAFKEWCGETAVMIGKSRVTTQDVVRAMVHRLLTDETFARKIRDDLRHDST